MNYAVIDARTGQILRRGEAPSVEGARLQAEAGEVVLFPPEPVDDRRHYYERVDGLWRLRDRPVLPDPPDDILIAEGGEVDWAALLPGLPAHAQIDINTRTAVAPDQPNRSVEAAAPRRTVTIRAFPYQDVIKRVALVDLAAARARVLETIKAERKRRERAFTHEGVSVAVDDGLFARLACALIAIEEREDEGTVVWQLAPGAYRELSARELRAFNRALFTYLGALFRHAERLAGAVSRANTFADINAIDGAAGWPD